MSDVFWYKKETSILEKDHLQTKVFSLFLPHFCIFLQKFAANPRFDFFFLIGSFFLSAFAENTDCAVGTPANWYS